ncbi:ABC transporter permease [Methyloprofundus sedimenti]|uniref:ABC transporter permease n=1 Tax=Methyloprofundus sedimenti TaxID=1420851 RepID=A0A1V8M7D0_9GAMM|nr:ABC transporter permease [Methyloprofundus sedimenti]OQK17481.1 ABC transporter permease [Methyloprofundus sedimenti]
MTNNNLHSATTPGMIFPEEGNGNLIMLEGQWTLRTLAESIKLRQAIKKLGTRKDKQWDISQVDRLDSAAAFLLWQAWGKQLPSNLHMREEHRRLFEQWHGRKIPEPQMMLPDLSMVLHFWEAMFLGFYQHICAWLTLFGRLTLDMIYLLGHPRAIPFKEISLTIYKAGVSALGITALVGLLVGVSMSYLSSLQLQRFGAEIYIIDLLGLSIIRELGPMLAAIIIAGRSGSSMTAEIGIMRVTQELDALSALGISHSLRLVLPKVVALSLVMPLLIVWTDVIALMGGMASAQLALDISYQQFFEQLPKSVPVVNVYIGLAKGVMFGMMIAMIACHFGFLIKPNTESLGSETTHAVVASITAVIMVDTVFSIVFRNVGFP